MKTLKQLFRIPVNVRHYAEMIKPKKKYKKRKKKYKKMPTAKRQAFHDISIHLEEQKVERCYKGQDCWNVFPSYMLTDNSQELNKELGIHKVNYIGNENGKKNNIENKLNV